VADVEQRVVAQIPLGRLGKPEDVSRAALWLCSEEAQWVSGAALPVDGAHWLHGGTLDFRGAHDSLATAAQAASQKQ